VAAQRLGVALEALKLRGPEDLEAPRRISPVGDDKDAPAQGPVF